MKKIKGNRLISFIIVLIVYIIASIVGVITYNYLNLDWWLSLLIADIAATIVTFIFSLIFNNASIYDPYWSVQPIVIMLLYSFNLTLNIYGILLIIVIALWAIRLTLNWAYTFSNLEHQDWRYIMLKENTGIFYPIINFIGIHMVPTLVVYFCIVPAVYALQENLIGNIGSIISLCISLFAVALQTISDIQMHKYRKNRDGEFNRHGLWKYSRHPNYLGEILMWWGIGLSVVCNDINSWFLLLGAFLNTILFLVVSIPMADKRQSRKKGFEEYKKETRMLLPIKK